MKKYCFALNKSASALAYYLLDILARRQTWANILLTIDAHLSTGASLLDFIL